MDPDETAWMRRLVWIKAGRKHTMLVMSCSGSNYFLLEIKNNIVPSISERSCMKAD
jgi:hypothetical protein